MIQWLGDTTRDHACLFVSLLFLPPGQPHLEMWSTRGCQMVAVSGTLSIPPPSMLFREREGCSGLGNFQDTCAPFID